ncbi:hypothetical protein DFJ43DRAFT_70880 [Lentinula guzmanii]|uniref:RING-type domain-containing protein n=1 Tax=Lentinula guzmanii TaxID=2804957 RepID=A0AA38JFM2_9AGAR|nr:hypothetical protein DFJ43DRAFT_70880 [Lentinula guzmanii]
MPHGHCQVCLGYYTISEFQILPCGHGGCSSCLDQIFDLVTQEGACWMCRQEFHRSRAHRIYIEVVDSKVAVLQGTIEGLEKMDAKVPVISVERASQRLKKTAQEIECDNEKAKSLQQAIEDFDERIVPVFKDVRAQAKELKQLRDELSRAKSRAQAFDEIRESSERKDLLINALRSELDQSKKDGQQVLSMMENLTTEHLSLKRQNELDMQDKKKKEDDNWKLRGTLERQAKDARSRKVKIQALKEEISNLRKRNESLEESQSVALDESLPVFMSDDYGDNSQNFLPSSSSAQVAPSPGRVRKKYRSFGLSQITNELHLANVDLDFDSGMPGPGFSSDWKMSGTVTKKKAAPTNFPIPLDKHGRPTVSVQTGPVRSRRVP